MTLSEKLVTPVYNIKYEDLPEKVINKAKLCVIHSLSCGYAGIEERWSKAARTIAEESGSFGKASVWFSDIKTTMEQAAFVNAVYAQSILYEDIHRDSNAHPGVVVIPAALAAAEETGASMEELLTAIVAGYEIMAKVGRGTNSQDFSTRGFRPTSITGTFGSCIAAGHLLKLTLEQQLAAFSLSASLASGINQWAIEGTDDLYIQNGNAAKAGILAAQLAKQGLQAPKEILEGKAGVCRAFGLSKEKLETQKENKDFAIMEVLFKPAPACALVQTTAQAGLEAAEDGVVPGEILKGTIYTFALGTTYAGCDNSEKFEKLLQARMSNQFNFAAALVKGKITNGNYCDFEDPDIRRLAGLLSLKEEPEYTLQFPEKQPVRVELELSNGEKKVFYKEEPVYLNQENVIEKLYEHCGETLGNKVLSIFFGQKR